MGINLTGEAAEGGVWEVMVALSDLSELRWPSKDASWRAEHAVGSLIDSKVGHKFGKDGPVLKEAVERM